MFIIKTEEKTTFSSYDEELAYYNRKLEKLKVSARTAIGRNRKDAIAKEIERYKRLIRVLQKSSAGGIEHALADRGNPSMEEK